MSARLEHANITVDDPQAIAKQLMELFDWTIRWEGPSLDNGHTLHVGNDTSYIAIYRPSEAPQGPTRRYVNRGGLNHIGVVVDDISAAEDRVLKMGYQPHSHADYEPGKRFYFEGPGAIEYEVVCYA